MIYDFYIRDMKMFNHLISKFKVIKSLDTTVKTVDNEVYSIDKENELTKFALNIVLILEGKRLVYKADLCDPDVNKFMIREALNYESSLQCINSLIFLKSNAQIIVDKLNKNIDSDQALGIILDYHYIGPYWEGLSNGDTYSISYVAKSLNKDYHLYTFNVPVNEYTQEIKNKILATQDSYNQALKQYGFNVDIFVLHQSENDVQGYHCLP